jgi:hypothetical protein
MTCHMEEQPPPIHPNRQKPVIPRPAAAAPPVSTDPLHYAGWPAGVAHPAGLLTPCAN